MFIAFEANSASALSRQIAFFADCLVCEKWIHECFALFFWLILEHCAIARVLMIRGYTLEPNTAHVYRDVSNITSLGRLQLNRIFKYILYKRLYKHSALLSL